MKWHVKSLILIIVSLALSSPVWANGLVLQGMVDYSPGTGKIGVKVGPNGKVYKVRPNSPAWKCGIVPGDKIVQADGKKDVVGRIHGTPGTTVVLVILRSKEEFTREVERVNEHLLLPYDAVIAETGTVD